jgi:hypothetical protein
MRGKIWALALVLGWISRAVVSEQYEKKHLLEVENLHVSNLKETRIVIAWEHANIAERFQILVQTYRTNFMATVQSYHTYLKSY